MSGRLNLPEVVRTAGEAALMFTAAIEADVSSETAVAAALAPFADSFDMSGWVIPPDVLAACRRSEKCRAAVQMAVEAMVSYAVASIAQTLCGVLVGHALAVQELAEATGRPGSEVVASLTLTAERLSS